MNRPPWSFVVVRERATLQAIAQVSPNTRHVPARPRAGKPS